MSKKIGITLIIITLSALLSGVGAYAADTTLPMSATAGSIGLKIYVQGTGLGTFDYVDKGPYAYNDVVVITAVPMPGSIFAGWTGDVNTTEPTITLTMDSDKVVYAEFTLQVVSFDLDQTSLDFGTVILGTKSASISVRTTNTGNVDIQYTTQIVDNGELTFFNNYLLQNGVAHSPTRVYTLAQGFNHYNKYELDLTSAPDSVMDFENFTGSLIYWAEATG